MQAKGGLEVSVSVIGSLFASFVPCQVTLNQFTGVLDDDEVYLLPLGMVDPGKAGEINAAQYYCILP